MGVETSFEFLKHETKQPLQNPWMLFGGGCYLEGCYWEGAQYFFYSYGYIVFKQVWYTIMEFIQFTSAANVGASIY